MFLYRCFDADDVLLYVGITGKLHERFRGHARSSDWWAQVAHHTAEVVAPADARRLERQAIHDEGPRFNKIGARRSYEKKAALDSWGDNLAIARAAAALTQFDLSRILDVSGLTVARWEADVDQPHYRRPSVEDQRGLGVLLATPISTLFPRSEREAQLEGLVAELEEIVAAIEADAVDVATWRLAQADELDLDQAQS